MQFNSDIKEYRIKATIGKEVAGTYYTNDMYDCTATALLMQKEYLEQGYCVELNPKIQRKKYEA